jgi:predicted nucleic acid-binding protein
LILDTNIILYEIRGLLDEPLPRQGVGISVLTKVELLGYPKLGAAEEVLINDVLQQLDTWSIDDQVASVAISLRRRQALKVPDAVIAATAIILRQDLWTNDVALAKIDGLHCRSVKLKPFSP